MLLFELVVRLSLYDVTSEQPLGLKLQCKIHTGEKPYDLNTCVKVLRILDQGFMLLSVVYLNWNPCYSVWNV